MGASTSASRGRWIARAFCVVFLVLAALTWRASLSAPNLVDGLSAKLQARGDRQITQAEHRALRESLLDRPLASDTLVWLARDAEAKGNVSSAIQLLNTAQRVSRRNAAVEAALVQRYANLGQTVPMLAALHALVSVYPDMSAVLLRPLAASLDRDEIRAGLIPYARQQARWMPALLDIAATAAPLDSLIRFVQTNAADFSYAPYQGGNAVFLARLAAAGRHLEVRRLLPRLIPGTTADVLDRWPPLVSTIDPQLGPLGWTLIASDGAMASLEEPGIISLRIAPLRRAAFAERDVLVVPGGRYVLGFAIEQDRAGGYVRLGLSVLCIREKGDVALFDGPISRRGGPAVVRVPISLPTDCHLMRVKLHASGPDSQFEEIIKISDFKLNQF